MDADENFQPPKGTDKFPWVEADLPTRIGLPREEVAALRKNLLTKNRDYITHKKLICWSVEGLRRVLDALDLADLPAFAKKPAPVRLEVFSVLKKTLNPRIILATDGTGRVVRVRVKSNEKFRPGMALKATHVAADLYQLAGNCPRFVGKY